MTLPIMFAMLKNILDHPFIEKTDSHWLKQLPPVVKPDVQLESGFL